MADFKQFTVTSGGSSKTYTVKDETARNGLAAKVNIAQGAGNAGKVMTVNDGGNIVPMSMASGIVYKCQFSTLVGTGNLSGAVINDESISADMVPIRWEIDNEEAILNDSLDLSISAGSASIGASIESGENVNVIVWIANNSNTANFDALFDRVEEINNSSIISVPFSLALADWSQDLTDGLYKATFVTNNVTTTSIDKVEFDSSIRLYATADVNMVKQPGGGGLVFETLIMPTGVLSGTIFVLDSLDGKTRLLGVNSIANNVTTVSEGAVLDARQGKVLNDQIATLNSKLTSETGTITTSLGTLSGNTILFKSNNICTMQLEFKPTNNVAAWATIANLPSGYRPSVAMFAPSVYNGREGIQVSSNGEILAMSDLTGGVLQRYASITWKC